MKQFKLPKEFAEKWLKALRSGEYEQGADALKTVNEDNVCFCCLGVAGDVCKLNDESYLISIPVFDNTYNYNGLIPEEIIGEADKNDLVGILTLLNDGINKYNYSVRISKKNYIFRNHKLEEFNFESIHVLRFTFNEIADFIEDNCEFYEEPIKEKTND